MRFIILLICLSAFTGDLHSQFSFLDEAYNKRSLKDLDAFFQSWRDDIPSISKEEFQNLSDTIKEAYKAFEAFYQPLKLAKIGGSE